MDEVFNQGEMVVDKFGRIGRILGIYEDGSVLLQYNDNTYSRYLFLSDLLGHVEIVD